MLTTVTLTTLAIAQEQRLCDGVSNKNNGQVKKALQNIKKKINKNRQQLDIQQTTRKSSLMIQNTTATRHCCNNTNNKYTT